MSQFIGWFASYGENKDKLEFAIWFHDVIYDSASQTNEIESATLAFNWLEIAMFRMR